MPLCSAAAAAHRNNTGSEAAGRPLEIGACDCGARTGLGGERSPQVLVAGEAEALGIGVDGDDHMLG